MISTVTTSTVSTVTLAGSVVIIGILLLLFFLVQKELTSASENERTTRLSKMLNIGIAPLLIAFVLVVISKVAAVLK
jgi:hypothetical protein